jgi:hypothetical protein
MGRLLKGQGGFLGPKPQGPRSAHIGGQNFELVLARRRHGRSRLARSKMGRRWPARPRRRLRRPSRVVATAAEGNLNTPL